jgi:hypothetical protein
MESLDNEACTGVGTETNPCLLVVPAGFTFDEEIDTTAETFLWCEGYFKLETTYLLGDVNHDGFVNVTDVSLTVNYILGNIPQVFFTENADIDQDGNINVTDITNIVNIILTIN